MKSKIKKIGGQLGHITLAALVLNFIWEMVQMPLFENMAFGDQHAIIICFYATLGDVAIILIFYLGGSVIFRTWEWISSLTTPRLIFLAIVGLLAAIYFETDALRTGRWQYSKWMPLIPGTDIGIVPLIQLMILPGLSYKLALRRCGKKPENFDIGK